jgi:hypothetical protein
VQALLMCREIVNRELRPTDSGKKGKSEMCNFHAETSVPDSILLMRIGSQVMCRQSMP